MTERLPPPRRRAPAPRQSQPRRAPAPKRSHPRRRPVQHRAPDAPPPHGHIPKTARFVILVFVFLATFGSPVLGYVIATLALILGGLNAAGVVHFPLSAMLVTAEDKQASAWGQRFGDLIGGVALLAIATLGLVAGLSVAEEERAERERIAEKRAADEAERQRIIAEREEREAALIAALPKVERQMREQVSLMEKELDAGNFATPLERASQIDPQLQPIHDVDWPQSLLDVEKRYDELCDRAHAMSDAQKALDHISELHPQIDKHIAQQQWLEADAMLLAVIAEARTVPKAAGEDLRLKAAAAVLAAGAVRDHIAPHVMRETQGVEDVQTTRSRTYMRRRGPGRGK